MDNYIYNNMLVGDLLSCSDNLSSLVFNRDLIAVNTSLVSIGDSDKFYALHSI